MKDFELDNLATEPVYCVIRSYVESLFVHFYYGNKIPEASQFYEEVYLAQTSGNQKFKHYSTGSGHSPTHLCHFMADSSNWHLEPCVEEIALPNRKLE